MRSDNRILIAFILSIIGICQKNRLRYIIFNIKENDDSKNELKGTSGVKYDTSDLSFTFPGFVSKEQYKIRAIGETVHGISIDTGHPLTHLGFLHSKHLKASCLASFSL